MKRYAAYDNDGIWETGTTADDALSRYQFAGVLSDDEIEFMIQGGLRVALMTDRLAERVEREGYDCNHPGYNWRILADGTLDLDLEA